VAELGKLPEVALGEATRLGADDAIVLAVDANQRILRFANNSLTVAKQTEETELVVYLAKERKTAIAVTSNPVESDVRSFVAELFGSMKNLAQSDHEPLPSRALKFKPIAGYYDERIGNAVDELPSLAKQAIDAANQAGARRTAGIISAGTTSYSLLSSNGTSGSDIRSAITLNIRAFADGDASGHGLSCAASMPEFNATEAGRRAGEDSRKMVGAVIPEAGEYEVLLSPTVASNLVGHVMDSASAFSVETGNSYLADKLGQKVASERFSLTDHGKIKGGLSGRSFDDEGMPTGSTTVIEGGMLRSYLHNLTTAKRWKTETTGNAGILSPHPWNIEVGAGDSSFDEMLRTMKRGVVLTSNWYTRFMNSRTGEFSTVPRDGAFLVEGGEMTTPLKGMRVSDGLERMFSSAKLLSKQREWIEWWEVDTPTLCPWLLADGVRITRAFE
jgi:PmbA protein